MNRRITVYWFLIVALAACQIASAQTFQFRVQQGSTLTTAADGGAAAIASDAPGKLVLANVTATYAGANAAVVTQVVIAGPPDFAVVNAPPMPQTLFAGQGLNFGIRFQPSNGARALALLYIHFHDTNGPRVATLNLSGTAPDFSLGYSLPPDNNFVPLGSGGTLSFPATSVNGSVTATVVIGNRGSGGGSVTGVSLAGAAFRLTNLPALPIALDPGREVRIGVVFAPRQPGNLAGTLSVTFAERTYTVQLVGATANPEFVLAYFFPSDGNVIAVSSGATLVFPATNVNATANAVVSVGNRGGGGGYIDSISITGNNFQLSGLPPFPVFVGADQELRVGVVFQPRDIGISTGTLRIVVDGRTLLLNLNGPSAGPRFSYEVIGNGSITAFAAGAKLTLPETALRETSSLAVQIRNTGNAEGTIAGIAVTGDGFRLSNVPILPYTMAPNSAVAFNVLFTPTQPGAASGRLRIGADSFELEGSAKGARLLYSYLTGGAPIELGDGRNVLWEPVQMGRTSRIELVIRNAGTSAATITPISIVEARSAFRLADIPELPAVVDAGGELVLALLFSPLATGDNSSRLRVGTETFNLIGAGTAPPELPAVQLRGPGQVQEPLQQRALSVVLAEPYPLPVSGTLTLTVNSASFVVDPAVQFSTGGRSVAFTIAANETQAQFPTGPEVYFQTGSVAGTISVRASFTTLGMDITPQAAPSLEVVIPAAAPRVLDIQLGARTANSLAVVITGMATTRSLEQLELRFVPSPKFNVPGGQFTLNIGSAASAWYRSRESEAYGSLFTASIPFTVQTQGDVLNLDEVFQSISATLANEKGRSNTLSVTPRP